jgi:hypothetical protein
MANNSSVAHVVSALASSFEQSRHASKVYPAVREFLCVCESGRQS